MHWSRGAIQKYAMHHDTAVVHMVRSSKYYLHGSFAGAGKGYSPVKLDMCACVLRHPAYLSLCVASATHKFVVQQPQPARQSPPLRCGYACKSVFAQAVWPQMPHVSSSSYSCNNTLAFPAEITLDDVQHLLYGKDLGLPLPFRDPWSHMPLEQIRQTDVPALDRVFTGGGVVSVVERLAAMGGWHAEPAAAERDEACVGTRLLRNRRGGGDQASSTEDDDQSGEHQGASSLRAGDYETDDAGSASEVDKPVLRVPLRGGASLLPLNTSEQHAETCHRLSAWHATNRPRLALTSVASAYMCTAAVQSRGVLHIARSNSEPCCAGRGQAGPKRVAGALLSTRVSGSAHLQERAQLRTQLPVLPASTRRP